MIEWIKKILSHKLIRFFLVGGLNSLFGYCIFALLIFVGLSYPWALLVGTFLGILFNFKTYGRLVFNSRDNKLIGRFILVYAVMYGFNYTGLTIFQSLGISNYVGGAILTIPSGLLGFFLNKMFVFSNKASKEPQQEVQK